MKTRKEAMKSAMQSITWKLISCYRKTIMDIWSVAYVDWSGRNPGGMVQILTEPLAWEDAKDLCEGMRADAIAADWGDEQCYRVIPTLNFSKPWNRLWRRKV